MRGTAVFLLCMVTIAHADLDDFYDNGCPKDTSIEKLIQHEKCEQYYQCHHGTLISRYCPSGLHFNSKLEKCDFRDDAGCIDKQTNLRRFDPKEDLDSTNPKHAALICLTPDSNGVLIAHEDCNEFYKCSYGKPVAVRCAEGLLYNVVNEKCDWPYNVDCNDRIGPERGHTTSKRHNAEYIIDDVDSNNSDPSQANEICSSIHSDGVMVAHEDCNKFYKCSRLQPVALNCPANLLYNTVKEICDWPPNVDCGERIIPENETKHNIDNDVSTEKNNENEENEISGSGDDFSPPAFCAIHEGFLIPHENCNQFYRCTNRRPVEFSCPINLVWNTIKGICDYPKNVDCGDRNIEGTDAANGIDNNASGGESGGKNSDPSQAPEICSAVGSDGVLVAHEHCNQYYKCHNESPVAYKCPSDLLYNPGKEFCDWPTFVDCGGRITPENSYGDENVSNKSELAIIRSPSATQADKICAGENSEGKFMPHENCNQFYKCFEGKAVALFCQLNLFYNPQKEYCDWSHNVQCGSRLIPGDSNEEEDNNENNSNACHGYSDGDIFAHENCSQFNKCVNGQLYAMGCPNGLRFNDTLKICDWPMNVNCGERIVTISERESFEATLS